MAYVRTVKTASGATAVQIVHSSRRGSRNIEHIGSAHDETELELLRAAARQRLAAGQGELDLGLSPADQAGSKAGGPLPITSSRMGHLWDALSQAYAALGFDVAAEGDEVFRCLVLARIIEPTSKLDSLRVLEEVGIGPSSYATVKRRIPVYATEAWRERLAAVCAAHAGLGPASLVLYDVSTLYFETDTGDGFREPGFSKERRLEPQITIGVRHEALCVRREVRDLPRLSVAGGGLKLRAADPRGSVADGWQAALTKSGRASTARWCGSGERVEKVYARNQCVIPR